MHQLSLIYISLVGYRHLWPALSIGCNRLDPQSIRTFNVRIENIALA